MRSTERSETKPINHQPHRRLKWTHCNNAVSLANGNDIRRLLQAVRTRNGNKLYPNSIRKMSRGPNYTKNATKRFKKMDVTVNLVLKLEKNVSCLHTTNYIKFINWFWPTQLVMKNQITGESSPRLYIRNFAHTSSKKYAKRSRSQETSQNVVLIYLEFLPLTAIFQLSSQPIQTFVKTIARRSARGLNVPISIT